MARPDVTEMLAWASRTPSEFVLEVMAREQDCTRWLLQEFKPTVIVAEHVLDLLATVSRDMTWATRPGHPLPVYVQALLLSQSVSDLYVCQQLAVKGMCDQAYVVGRTAVEAGFRILFLRLYPDDWESVFMTSSDVRAVGGSPKGRRQFDVTALLKQELKQPEILRWFYDWPSRFLHGNRQAATHRLASVLKGDFSAYVPVPGPPPSIDLATWYSGFTNFYQNVLYFHVLLNGGVLGTFLPESLARELVATRDGLRRWCSMEGNAHANLVTAWDELVVSSGFQIAASSPS